MVVISSWADDSGGLGWCMLVLFINALSYHIYSQIYSLLFSLYHILSVLSQHFKAKTLKFLWDGGRGC